MIFRNSNQSHFTYGVNKTSDVQFLVFSIYKLDIYFFVLR